MKLLIILLTLIAIANTILLNTSTVSVSVSADDSNVSISTPHYLYNCTGNCDRDSIIQCSPNQQNYVLMGGGGDQIDCFQSIQSKLLGGDIIILRTHGTDAYNQYLYSILGGFNSVSTMILYNRTASYDNFILNKLSLAEGIFIAGGDQSEYYNNWINTPIQALIQSKLMNNTLCSIGGTSAGTAILGGYIFTAEINRPGEDGVTSLESMMNPYNQYITLSQESFIKLPYIESIYLDMHFHQHDRMGRLLVFTARSIVDKWINSTTTTTHSIGIDESTCLDIDYNTGNSIVKGRGKIYIITTVIDYNTIICEPDIPITFYNNSIQRLDSYNNDTYSLFNWSIGKDCKHCIEPYIINIQDGEFEYPNSIYGPK